MTLGENYCIISLKLKTKGVSTIQSCFRTLRISAGLTQKEVADYLGISQVSVWQWENNENMPRADKLPAIAKLFGCDIADLIERKEA